MRIVLLILIWLICICPRTGFAQVVFDANWVIDPGASAGGIKGELRDGTTRVANFKLVRQGVSRFTTSVSYTGGGDLLISEVGQNNNLTHSVTYLLDFDGLNTNYAFLGYTVSQYGLAGTGPTTANPDIAFSWSGGGSATVNEPGYDMFSNAADGGTFSSPHTLTSAGSGDISAANASLWSVDAPSTSNSIAVTYTTGLSSGTVNGENLAYSASFYLIPEPQTGVFFIALMAFALMHRHSRRRPLQGSGS